MQRFESIRLGDCCGVRTGRWTVGVHCSNCCATGAVASVGSC